jgi:hypothetical protein
MTFTQIISKLRKEMEDYKKCHVIIGDESETAFCQQYEDYKILQAKLDQTLLCEKKHKDFIEKLKKRLEERLCLHVVPCFKRLRKNPCYNCQKIFNVLAEIESEVTK